MFFKALEIWGKGGRGNKSLRALLSLPFDPLVDLPALPEAPSPPVPVGFGPAALHPAPPPDPKPVQTRVSMGYSRLVGRGVLRTSSRSGGKHRMLGARSLVGVARVPLGADLVEVGVHDAAGDEVPSGYAIWHDVPGESQTRDEGWAEKDGGHQSLAERE